MKDKKNSEIMEIPTEIVASTQCPIYKENKLLLSQMTDSKQKKKTKEIKLKKTIIIHSQTVFIKSF